MAAVAAADIGDDDDGGGDDDNDGSRVEKLFQRLVAKPDLLIIGQW